LYVGLRVVSEILVEESRPMVNVEVDERFNVHGHVNLDAWGQGQERPRA
jgi:hypothetical protein